MNQPVEIFSVVRRGKQNSGIRLPGTLLAVANQSYPKISETLNHQREPQGRRRFLKRLSTLDTADNPATIDETAYKIIRNKNLSSLHINGQGKKNIPATTEPPQ